MWWGRVNGWVPIWYAQQPLGSSVTRLGDFDSSDKKKLNVTPKICANFCAIPKNPTTYAQAVFT